MKKENISYKDEPFRDGSIKHLGVRRLYKICPTTENGKEFYSDKILQGFDDDYKRLIDLQVYFYGCPLNIYTNTYKQRLNDFLEVFNEAKEIDFIEYELNKGISKIEYVLSKVTHMKIKHSLKVRFEFLESRAFELGFVIESNEDDFKIHLIDTSQPITNYNESIFTSSDAENIFNEYYEMFIKENESYYSDLSFIFHTMRDDKFIYIKSQKGFKDWLIRENLTPKGTDNLEERFIKSKGFYTKGGSHYDSKKENYNIIKRKYLNID